MHQAAGVLLIDKNGAIIGHQRDDKPGIAFPGKIGFFGGGVEENETPLEGAIRELEEETNLQINPNRFKLYKKFEALHDLTKEKQEVFVFLIESISTKGLKVYEGRGFVVLRDLDAVKAANIVTDYRFVFESWFIK